MQRLRNTRASCLFRLRMSWPHASRGRLVRGETGLVTLEALLVLGISLPIIIGFTMFFPMLLLRESTAHALLQTAESLAMDSYGASQVNEADAHDTIDLAKVKKAERALRPVAETKYTSWSWPTDEEFSSSKAAASFARIDKWYDLSAIKSNVRRKTHLAEVVKARFLLYLGGDAETAGKFLEDFYVVDGVDGLQFYSKKIGVANSDSSAANVMVDLDPETGRQKLSITLVYYFKYPLWTFTGPMRITQSASTLLWTTSK